MNVFNGKLELLSASPVNDSLVQWDISATFLDAAGLFYASDVIIGDIIYNDITSFNMGISRYKVVSIDSSTDYTVLYARIEWALPEDLNNPVAEPFCGFETLIGRSLYGAVYLPSASAQGLTEVFLEHARNVESWLIAKNSYVNRLYNVDFTGEIDGINTDFTPVVRFIPETLCITMGGLRLKNNIDYTVANNTVSLVEAPVEENLVIDLNIY